MTMTHKEYRGVMVIVEQEEGRIHPLAYELLGKGKELAQKLNVPVYAALLGPDGMETEELIYRGAHSIYYCAHEAFLLPQERIYKENLMAILTEVKPEIILIGATTFGRSLAPRLAIALETGLTADCTGLEIDEDGALVQIRPAFSENILAHIKTTTYPQMATIRYREFSEGERDTERQGEVKHFQPVQTEEAGVEVMGKVGEQEVRIAQAQVVVAAGRGVKAPSDMAMLEELAEALGGMVGVTRSLVDAGFMSKDHQVGYSGHRVKPRLYIACGISGAPQHLAGMKESDSIIAINNDPSAPIFEMADYGIVGDLYTVVPALIRTLKEEGSILKLP